MQVITKEWWNLTRVSNQHKGTEEETLPWLRATIDFSTQYNQG